MLQKISCLPLIGKICKNHQKATFASVPLVNKIVRTSNYFRFSNLANKKGEAVSNVPHDGSSFLLFGDCTVYHKKGLTYEMGHRRSVHLGNSTECIIPTHGIRNSIRGRPWGSESPHRSEDSGKGTPPTNSIRSGCVEKTLHFSWLKTIRKKQYYKIIGKMGVKKRNAGMYWSFYVNKRKKIRKKRRTI
ncbi:conserved Plasmodium protein, unknown function [Plasmodium vivax]|uniref:Uncharacterized protein n=6 Tax=Plasmodium vivax TaxID=5855 RepID=A5K3W2_PLAVS|nr:hypothetical protein, conserved [Plasmodium vivax]KMZ78913.1 hypothetical protein PVIIG_00308 [Plasmodium vivax India VII]KMZ87121.1 hypothetical protein PVBG_03906 [Plasmodium vivax Brazil I]KMZ91759.1 hypothetical protein PVMG_00632 [Plasmodium vivax Mauritania I]KMZ97783.1 hypothetical protein PVNG_03630 [Plasmodium vivax North Korean]EDL46216.1 hypothetical protein, conserved [Plasmodium vivax]|eukprot:XP_001615943.1 hypothetical protein [Plasmodium vivax Sal-1]